MFYCTNLEENTEFVLKNFIFVNNPDEQPQSVIEIHGYKSQGVMHIETTKIWKRTPHDIRNNCFVAKVNNKQIVIFKDLLFFIVYDAYGIDLEWLLVEYV